MRWFDALGPFKWPSAALVLAPLVAYPFWSPEAKPAQRCGAVIVEGRAFEVYPRPGGEELVLRPTRTAAPDAVAAPGIAPAGFDAGGAVVRTRDLPGVCKADGAD